MVWSTARTFDCYYDHDWSCRSGHNATVDELLSPESAVLEDSPSRKLPSSSGQSWFSSLPKSSLRTMQLRVAHVGFVELQISKHGPVMLGR